MHSCEGVNEPQCDAPCEIKSSVKQPAATEMIMGHEKARCIEIEQLDYGYKVSVGCQKFAIQNLDVLLTLLGSYLRDPRGFESMWREGTLKIG